MSQYVVPLFIPARLDFGERRKPFKKTLVKRLAPPPPVATTQPPARSIEPLPDPGACFKRLILPSGGVRFDGEEFRRLCRPLVYMFLKDNTPLYIGFSAAGLARPSQNAHHAKRARQEADEILIWPTKTEADARELESILIFAMQPKYNRRRPADPMKKIVLGVSRLTQIDRAKHVA
jgi:hypothetical protein